jgi:O-antigen/teichoic acid export membrane protein
VTRCGGLLATVGPRLQALFERVAGVSLGPGGRSLTKSLGYLIGADTFGSAVTFVLTAWFVRRLGPEEFGLANLAVAVAQIWVIFLLGGLHTAATREIAADPNQVPTIISTTFAAGGLLWGVLALLCTVWGNLLAQYLGVRGDLIAWSFVLATAECGYYLVHASLSGLKRFGDIARYAVSSTLGFAAIVAGLLAARSRLTFADFVAASALRWSLFCLFGLAGLRTFLGRPSLARARHLLAFGGYSTAASLCSFFILGGIDNVMLNAYHGADAVGLYGAYYVVFNLVTSRMVKVVSAVMVPTAASSSDRAALRRRVLQMYWRTAWLLGPSSVGLTFVVFRAYGDAYDFDWVLAGLMGANIWLHAVSSSVGDFLVAAGIRGVRSSLYAAAVTATVNVGANLLLIPSFGVGGTMVASSLAFSVALALRLAFLRRLEP